MARKTPTVKDTRLYFYDLYEDNEVFVLNILDDWQHWQRWLNDEMQKSFRFVADDGTCCSVVKEYKAHYGRRKRPVWMAYRRLDYKLRRKYLGKSENVTYSKLKAFAFELSQRQLG